MAGAAGTRRGDPAGPRQILYDEEFRSGLARAQQAFLTPIPAWRADGQAAERAAEAIVQLAR